MKVQHVPHVPGLGAYVVLDAEGLQAFPKPGMQETQGACQRFIERWDALDAARYAARTINQLTERELSPSTVDLLTLQGIERDAQTNYFDQDEKLAIVRKIRGRYGVIG